MVTEATCREVWNDLLDVSKLARYAQAMGSRYRVRHLFIRFGLLVAASGSMATGRDSRRSTVTDRHRLGDCRPDRGRQHA